MIACTCLGGGCAVLRDEPVRPTPTLTFVAGEEPPSEVPQIAESEMLIAGPTSPPGGAPTTPATADEQPVTQPRFLIAANDMRIRFDNLEATIALAPESLDSLGRAKLDRLRAILSSIDGELLQLKVARAENVAQIESRLERSLSEGDKVLRELSTEVNAARVAGRQ